MAKADFDGANVPSIAVQTQSLVKEDQRRSQWLSASHGHYKINFDVATKKKTTKATVAAILRDSGGRILDGLVKQWSILSSFQGEALACRCACQLAQACNLSEVEIEGDNKEVIHLCVSKKVPPWECGVVFDDIKRLANQGNLFFNWSPRTANTAAHWVAQEFLRGWFPLNWVFQPPPALALC